LQDGVAFELYWAEFNHNDIVRESVGFTSIENHDTINADGITLTVSTLTDEY
jgi:hypothetical protein